jgi:hypothetical protein
VFVYPVRDLLESGPANDVVADLPIAVVVDPATPDRWNVFHRRVEARILTLVARGDRIVDEQTGTVWDVSNGRAFEGPLEGMILDVLPGFTVFEADTRTFWPDAEIWDG